MIAVDAALLAGAFLAGSIPFSYLITRLITGRDIREMGSNNAGATNVYRCVGAVPGLATLILDVAKGSAAVWAAAAFGSGSTWIAAAAGLAAVAGHAWPPWLSWRGGKGVATAAGAFLVLSPASLGLSGIVFVLILLVTRKIAPASLAASATLPLFCLWRAGTGASAAVGSIMALLIFWLHRSNIRRLLRGEEPSTGKPGEAGLDRET